MTTNSNKFKEDDTISNAGSKVSKGEGALVPEIGGFADKKLPEPTRYGDWEVGGRCSDF